MGKTRDEKSEATNRHISSSTKCNSKQTVEKSNEHPEWLPNGWNVDFRTRKSGANMGYGYKCYIDPSGHKFYSKPEVLRYIETVNSKTHTSKKDKDVIGKSLVEDLPPGWITEAKVRKGGTGNKKDLLHIDPLSGYVFRSKKDALRYLNSGDISTCVLKPYKRHIQDEDKITDAAEKSVIVDLPPGQITEVKIRKGSNGNTIDPDVVEKLPVEDLPPGWITEAKVRKGGTGNKKDLFYIDPASEYVFRSKKDALRYLNSGDISTCVLKPYKRQILDEDKITTSSIGKKLKLNQSATRRQLFAAGQQTYDESALELPDAHVSKKGQDVTDSSGMMSAPVLLGEPVVKKQSLKNAAALTPTPETKKTSDPDDVQEKIQVNMMEHASKKYHSNRSLSKTKESNVARHFSRRLSGAEPDQLTNVPNEQALEVPKRNLRKSRSVLDTDLTNKSFQQLNGVLEIEQSHKMHAEVPLTSNKSSNKKEHQILHRASKRLAGFEPELMGNSISNKRAPEYKSKRYKGELNATFQQRDGQPAMELADHASINGESSNKGRKLPETTPITSSQLKKFDDEEMNNDEKLEPEQSLAFHYSWSDPCLEFAIQALTGALPAEDSVGNGPVRISETHMSPKNKSVENVTGSSSDKNLPVNSRKPKNKKEHTMPRRLSKRLAGHEPEVLPTEKAIEYVTGKPCNDKPAATAILTNGVSEHLHAREESKLVVQASDSLKTPCGESSSKSEKSYDAQTIPNKQVQRLEAENVGHEPEVPTEKAIEYVTGKPCHDKPAATAILTNGVSEHLHAREESKLVVQASDSLKTPCGESSSKSEKSYDAQTIPNKQVQSLEAENVGDDKLDSEFPSLFGDSWSDPCLDFAIKTLTGALPVDTHAAADILPVMTLDINNPPNEELLDSMEQKTIIEKEFNTVCQPSKQILNQPELTTYSTSCGNDPKFATRESYKDGDSITGSFNGRESQRIEAGKTRQMIDINQIILEEEPSEEKQVIAGESVAEKPQPETIINHDNSERAFCLSLMDSWSDPCLEFAFNTLTDTIPEEENIAIQGRFQEPADRHDQRGGDLIVPDFGFSSISHSGISFHNDMGEKSRPGQQSSTSSSFLPQEKPNLHGFSGVAPQDQYFKYSNNFQRR